MHQGDGPADQAVPGQPLTAHGARQDLAQARAGAEDVGEPHETVQGVLRARERGGGGVP